MRLATVVVASFVTACSSPPAPTAHSADPSPPAERPVPAAPAPAPTSFVVKVSGHGRPAIFIPGLGCPGSVWDATIAHLAGSVEAHVITLAGFAGVPPRTATTAPLSRTVRDELVAYLRAHHLDHPIVVGHSMGAFLAMWLAATVPDEVGPVILVDGGARIDVGGDAAARQARDGILAASAADFAQQTREMFQPMFSDAARGEPVIAQVVRSDQHVFAQAIYELFTIDLRSELPKIAAPALAVLSDGPFHANLEAQLTAIPSHQIVTLPNTRHFVMLDDPAAFFALVDKFLAAHPK